MNKSKLIVLSVFMTFIIGMNTALASCPLAASDCESSKVEVEKSCQDDNTYKEDCQCKDECAKENGCFCEDKNNCKKDCECDRTDCKCKKVRKKWFFRKDKSCDCCKD